MKQKFLMIPLSCASGAGIGVLLASRFHWNWQISVTIGGILGYIVYDYKQIIAAAPVAWKEAKQNEQLHRTTLDVLAALSLIICIMGIIIGYGELTYRLSHKNAIFAVLGMITALISGIIMVSVPLMYPFMFGPKIGDRLAARIKKASNERTAENLNFLVGIVTFLCAPVLLLWTVIRLLIALVEHFMTIVRFVKNLLILIYSDVRLLVGISSVIGGTVGHFWNDSVLIGMAAGAGFGLFNYWVVSIKWLKLNPQH